MTKRRLIKQLPPSSPLMRKRIWSNSVITDEKWRKQVEQETRGFTYFDNDHRPRIGSKRVFVYGAYSESAAYIKHRFHVVTVLHETEDYDYEGERMFRVQADDGWEGDAWASELFPLPRNGAQ